MKLFKRKFSNLENLEQVIRIDYSRTTTLMVSNEEMEDIMKIVKPQRGEFYPSLLGTLGVTF